MKIDDRFLSIALPVCKHTTSAQLKEELMKTCTGEYVPFVTLKKKKWGRSRIGVPDHIVKLMENYAEGQESVHVLKLLKNHILVQACKDGCSSFVDALIRAGADVNMTDFHGGDTPLIAAARSGSIHCMRSVLRAGADVNISDSHGYNALGVLINTFQKTNCSQTKNCILLLVAAGEMISQSRYNELKHSLLPDDDDDDDDDDVKKNRKTFEKLRLQLMHNCRASIRKHLLGLDPHQNLFKWIRQLPLPPALMSYLLLDVSLKRRNSNQDNIDETTGVSLKPGNDSQDNMNEATDVSLKPGNENQDIMNDATDVSLKPGNENQDNMNEATDVSLKPGNENQDIMNDATDVSLKPGDENQDNVDDETLMAMMMMLKSVQIKDVEKKTV